MKTAGESLSAGNSKTQNLLLLRLYMKNTLMRRRLVLMRGQTDVSATHLQNSSIDLCRLTRVLQTYLSELYCCERVFHP